eukprot:4433413-Pleurochrysis_carterae.AAC.1
MHACLTRTESNVAREEARRRAAESVLRLCLCVTLTFRACVCAAGASADWTFEEVLSDSSSAMKYACRSRSVDHIDCAALTKLTALS